jgi:4-amino-4-deoxy-L-arabinose transferase-like glycosyltransferase
MDSDEAINGLMAKHILTWGTRPIFFYGQAYNGVLYQYLTVPIFALFGVSILTLKAVPLAISVLFVYLIYLLAVKLTNHRAGLVAMLIAGFCPPFINLWNVSARSEYVVTLTLGTLILFLGYEILFARRYRREILYLLLGLVSGAAFWTSQLVTSYILAVFCCIFWQDKRFLFRRTILLFLLGFVVGNLPMIIFNLRYEWAAVASLWERGSSPPLYLLKSFPLRLGKIFSVSFPIMLGGSLWELETAIIRRFISVILLLFFFLSLLFVLWQRIRDLVKRKKNPIGTDLLLFHFLITVVLFSLSRFGWLYKEPRYLLPLFTSIPIFQAIALDWVRNKSKWIFSGCLTVLILCNLYGNINFSPTLDPDHSLWPRDKELNDYLVQNNILYPVAHYWIAYKITFETNERVIVIPYSLELFDMYRDRVDITQAGRYLIVPKKGFTDPLFRYFSYGLAGPLDNARECAQKLQSKRKDFTTREFTHYVLFDLGTQGNVRLP